MTDKQTETSPKYSAQRCPVCNGFGTVSNKRVKCHGCSGRGFVTIDNESGLPVLERKKDENKDNLY